MKLNKRIAVELIDDAETAFSRLNNCVGKQQKKGITRSEEITLLHGIERAVDLIVANPFYGRNAKKKQIPKEYIKKYDVDNLFIVNLPNYWRMIYTLESNKVEIIAFVLDIFDHKSYDKKFKYKGK
ncbi:MAG: hypothetical protein OXR66_08345 [Candidatus Woesearchaeota archaeon]|nr:hypothetical protein [Candidatus Woesearchaeota archaeon]